MPTMWKPVYQWLHCEEYEETNQDDVNEDEDDSENISKSEWNVQCNSGNEGNGSVKRDNNLATGPGGG